MIQFTLKCDKGHRFDSWFASNAAFEKLQRNGMAVCPVCGSTHVEKALMAPRVRDSKATADVPAERPLTSDPSPAEQAMAEMRRHVEENSEYVGLNFAQEARDIHNGDAPDRAIYGEAKPKEAKALIEEGVPVAPLPFVPGRKSN
ncbi:MAG: DUF1178 family protein [Pseudomonadota bacterium]